MLNEYIKPFFKRLKKRNGFTLIIVIGILLIGLSSFLPAEKEKENVKTDCLKSESSEYKKELEEKIKKTVTRITGDKSACVLITFESSFKYAYARETEENSEKSVENEKNNVLSEQKSKYITVKTKDGGEKALLITQYMPRVRGVSVVVRGGENKAVAESIKNAVTAALGITSKRVYVTSPVVIKKS